ncbi:MAG: hypothetical protein WC617_09810 [Rhodanobacter sp.]|jgi:hypothetical protein
MNFSLRWLKRSVSLRTLAVLAWLMLASTSVGAAPSDMGVAAMHAGQAVASVNSGQPANMGSMAHGVHGMTGQSCCGGHLSQGCNCHSACGNALPSVLAFVAMSASFATVYARPSLTPAPSPNPAPPWRPPSV